jgi:hypothetical protein
MRVVDFSRGMLAGLFFVIVCLAALGAESKPYEGFWKQFQAAVVAGDRQAVATQTKLPFLLEGKNLDRAAFVAKFDQLFSPKMKGCFAKAKPMPSEAGFDIFCGEQIFLFEKTKTGYRFAEIGVND